MKHARLYIVLALTALLTTSSITTAGWDEFRTMLGSVFGSGGTTNKVAKFTGATSIGDGTITDDGSALTLGDGTDTVEIASSDWDISTTGIMTGIGNITTNGTITMASSDVISNATDATFTFTRNDAGTVTLIGADNSTPCDTTLDTTGAGAITIGSADVTAITLTTDGSGTDEVVLPNGSVATAEIADDTITFANISDSSAIDADTTFTMADGIELVLQPSHTDGSTEALLIDMNQVDDSNALDSAIALKMELTSESNDAGDAFYGLVIGWENGTANTIIDAAIFIDNAEATASTMTDGILITSSGVDGGVVDGLDVSASGIVNALNIGANEIHSEGTITLGRADAGTITLTATDDDANSGLVIGNGTDTLAIASSGLDLDTAGNLTGVVAITNSGTITSTGSYDIDFSDSAELIAIDNTFDINGGAVDYNQITLKSNNTDTTAHNLTGYIMSVQRNNTINAGGYDGQGGVEIILNDGPNVNVASAGVGQALYIDDNRAGVEADTYIEPSVYIETSGTHSIYATKIGHFGGVLRTESYAELDDGLIMKTTLPGDPTTANYLAMGNTGFLFEGSSADTNEFSLLFPTINPASDIITYIPASKWATAGATTTASLLPTAMICEAYQITNEDYDEAAHTADVVIATLPIKAVLKGAIIVVKEQGVFAADSLTLSLGSAAVNYDQIIVDCDGKGAVNTIYGDLDAELGTDLTTNDHTMGALYSVTATQAVTLHVDGNANNLTTVSAGDYDIYLYYIVLPTVGE